jgi:5-methylcytosine-specific restriction endonuclease McrA
MKHCSTCGVLKSEDEYYTQGKDPRGHVRKSGKCKSCQLEYRKQRYDKHVKFIADYKLERGCERCGYKKDHVALDMAHINPTTKWSYGKYSNSKYGDRGVDAGWSLKKIKIELAKCKVLCANCHRIETVRGTK